MYTSRSKHPLEQIKAESPRISKLPPVFKIKPIEELIKLCYSITPASGDVYYRDIHDCDHPYYRLRDLAGQTIHNYEIFLDETGTYSSVVNRMIFVTRVRIYLEEPEYWYTIPVNFIELSNVFFNHPKL